MKFTKMGRGEYAFEVDGVTYIALRNEAGFAHRDWDLYRDGRVVADQLASRAECVKAAEGRVALAKALATLVAEPVPEPGLDDMDPEGQTYVVDIFLPLSVSVRAVKGDERMAKFMALDMLWEEKVRALIEDAIDPTSFFLGDANPRFEVGEA